MKGPGAILLIGVGVFILALGWTGKWAEVYAALTGGGTLPDPGDVVPGEIPKGVPGGPPADKPPEDVAGKESCEKRGGRWFPGVCGFGTCPIPGFCIGGSASDAPTEGCPADHTLVVASSSGTQKCVANVDLQAPKDGKCPARWNQVVVDLPGGESRLLCQKPVTSVGGGQAYGRDYAKVPLPTGYWGFRYQPNY